jgi:hypothetical protein
LHRIRSKITYANIVATLALFIALGGASYAAIKLPADSVGTSQLKSGAVTGDKVKNGSLHRSDFAPGELPVATQGVPGPAGQAGAKGEGGDRGATGETGQRGEAGERGMPGERGAPGTDGTSTDASLLNPANDLPESASLEVEGVVVATVASYRIECSTTEECTLAIGTTETDSTLLNSWFQAALVGNPTARRDATLVLFDPQHTATARYVAVAAEPVARRFGAERLEMTFSAEQVQPIST